VSLYQQELERRAKQAESYLAVVQDELREKGIATQVCVDYAPSVKAIIRTAEREGADLVAMAAYGSLAAGVLHRIDRPLLLIQSGGC
jgi:nucleotide-binding universal stress UspA family protein